MNLSQLCYFKKLVEVRHYSKAARELFISQPTLSSAISSLERELGVSLFHREDRGIRPTEYGEVFYGYVRSALRELDDGIAAVRSHEIALNGTVNLGAIFTVQGDYLPQLLKEFMRSAGESVLVKTYQNFTNNLIGQLHDGSLDLAFCGCRDGEPHIEYLPATCYDLKLCVRREHPLAARDCVRLRELEGYSVYSYAAGTPIGDQVSELLELHGLNGVKQVYQEDVALAAFLSYGDDATACALMLDSVGMKLFSNLVAIAVEEVPSCFYSVYLAYHTKHKRSRAADQLIEFVRKRHAIA